VALKGAVLRLEISVVCDERVISTVTPLDGSHALSRRLGQRLSMK
jgi:hypothetical protein